MQISIGKARNYSKTLMRTSESITHSDPGSHASLGVQGVRYRFSFLTLRNFPAEGRNESKIGYSRARSAMSNIM